MEKLYCNDGCQEEFTLLQMETGLETLQDNIERHYIECPTCGQQYTSYYLDDQMKHIQLQIRTLRGKEPLKVKQKNRLINLEKRIQFMGNQLRMKVEQSYE